MRSRFLFILSAATGLLCTTSMFAQKAERKNVREGNKLYESEKWADRETDTRCSRVYFMLGTYGHIYILFFDPYHELNPMRKP